MNKQELIDALHYVHMHRFNGGKGLERMFRETEQALEKAKRERVLEESPPSAMNKDQIIEEAAVEKGKKTLKQLEEIGLWLG